MQITAHSGCDNTPMNSPEYLYHGITLDVDALEIDVRRTADGELILTHDAQDPPDEPFSLREAFAILTPAKCAVNCDLKEYGLESAVIRTATAVGLARERLIFTGAVTPFPAGQWPDFMRGVRVYLNIEELIPNFYEILSAAADKEALVQKALDTCVEKGCHVINVNFQICTPAFLQMCQERRLQVSAWTVNDEKAIQALLSAPIFNITTCVPESVRRLATQLGTPENRDGEGFL